jgi:hypothetical protein
MGGGYHCLCYWHEALVQPSDAYASISLIRDLFCSQTRYILSNKFRILCKLVPAYWTGLIPYAILFTKLHVRCQKEGMAPIFARYLKNRPMTYNPLVCINNVNVKTIDWFVKRPSNNMRCCDFRSFTQSR